MAALLLFALLALVSLKGTSTSRASEPIHALAFVVERRAGPPVLLQFQVRAGDGDAAFTAVQRALPRLVPGGRLAEDEPGVVSAQWAQWSWLWDDSELPVPVAYNPTGGPPSIGPPSIIPGLRTWSEAPGSRFAFQYAGFTDHGASLDQDYPDGENVIAWKWMDCSKECVLGVTSKELTHESDLVLNSNPDAHLGDGMNTSADAETVVLHEAGHMAGLEHSCPAPFGPCTEAERNAVMYFQYRGIRRRLEADDIAGIAALYPARTTPSPTPTPPPGPVTLPVSLQPGWNLVLLPAGALEPTTSRLACLAAVYDYTASGWNAWLRAFPRQQQALVTTEPGRAYWALAHGACAAAFTVE